PQIVGRLVRIVSPIYQRQFERLSDFFEQAMWRHAGVAGIVIELHLARVSGKGAGGRGQLAAPPAGRVCSRLSGPAERSPGPVAQLGDALLAGAVRAAAHASFTLEAMADNAYVAMLAHRRDHADCAFETIECVSSSGYS